MQRKKIQLKKINSLKVMKLLPENEQFKSVFYNAITPIASCGSLDTSNKEPPKPVILTSDFIQKLGQNNKSRTQVKNDRLT